MLTYTFNKSEKISLYKSLYNNIKNDILNGILKPGEKLPSKRTFAQHLKLSVITVENAYSQLIDEGYIYSVEKKGYYINKVEKVLPVIKKPLFNENNGTVDYFMDFRKNSISTENFPFTVWAKTMREVILEQDKKLLQPLRYNGVRELREAIADYLFHYRGIDADPEQIIIGAGTEYLYTLIAQLLGKNKIYALENPGYTKITKIYNINGIECLHIGIDNEGMSADELKAVNCDVVHISPSHHYPTGIVMSVGRRQALLRWANGKEGRYILEDDYDSEFRFAGMPVPSMFSTDEGEKVIYINTFSKTIAPSIRISYMILPSHLLKKFKSQMDFYTCTVPGFEQYTLAKFISQGSFGQHINRMKKLYHQKRDAVISAVQQSPLSDIVTIKEEKAGLHFLMKINTDLSDREIEKKAAEKGICLACLSDYLYVPDNKYDHTIVVNYSGIETEKLKEAITRISKVFKTT